MCALPPGATGARDHRPQGAGQKGKDLVQRMGVHVAKVSGGLL